MRLQNLLKLKTDSFFNELVDFLKFHLGSNIMAWVTLGIIGILSLSLLICTLIAIFGPSKRKLKKLNKTLKRQKDYDFTRHRIFELSEEISSTNLEIRILKKQLEDDIFNLTEIERSALEQDNFFIVDKRHQMDDLNENIAILVKVLEQK